ncbi:serine/threonine protein kinase [Streptomyces sp. NBC_01429]|uniref:serine/threonine protein kinase n=1 Tax=Streptomyces sp. NBC_01429 TaxID=2903862 RepID=UPI002E2C5507|nr:serine/threonine protein kinase [Streptomyces sp. NBC_01429]
MNQLRTTDPTKLGHHTILGRIGAGGMGQVYLGRSPGGRLLALKVVRDDFAQSADVLTRFRREVETVGRVRSAYTAALVDYDVTSKPYWLATEYVSGPTLGAAVPTAEGLPAEGLPAEVCLLLFAALAEALADVHARGVSHRDLKPQNIILSSVGPRLIDFGIARATDHTVLTQAGQTVGSLGYTAPEAMTEGPVGPAADMFALGATMAYAATGRAPFGSTMASVVYRSMRGETDLTGVDSRVAELITSCVSTDPALRPDPAEIIRRCDVRTSLTENPVYRALVAQAETPVPDPTRAAADATLMDATLADARTAPRTAPMTALAPAPDSAAHTGTGTGTAGSPPGRDRRRTFRWAAAAVAVLVVAGSLTAVGLLRDSDTSKTPKGSGTSHSQLPDPPPASGDPAAEEPAPEEPAPAEGALTGMNDTCAHIANSDPQDGSVLQVWTCNGTEAQRWQMTEDGRLQALGKCMDVEWSGTENGTPVRLWECNTSDAQKWEPQPDGTLRNTGSGRCLDIPSGNTENGTELAIWDCMGNDNQIWRLPG